jgi:hypothetical protein
MAILKTVIQRRVFKRGFMGDYTILGVSIHNFGKGSKNESGLGRTR